MKISRGLIGTALGITLSALLLSPPVAQADVVTDANARATRHLPARTALQMFAHPSCL